MGTLSQLLAGLRQISADAAARPSVPPTAPVASPADKAAPATAGAPLARLNRLLLQFAGFRPSDILNRKLERILASIPPNECNAWLARLEQAPASDEMHALVEDLTNHETYFFRDGTQLTMLEKHVLPALIARKKASGDTTLRLWSAGCSTGEEPYTLAIMALRAMMAAGVAREALPGDILPDAGWRLEVLGTDISRQALRIATTGAYRDEISGSFRGLPGELRRFFERTTQVAGQPAWSRVRDSVRRHVRFEMLNLLNRQPPRRQQDLVVCRNVLIYIAGDRQASIQRMLADALAPGGLLMLGFVDTLHCPELFRERWHERCVIHERK